MTLQKVVEVWIVRFIRVHKINGIVLIINRFLVLLNNNTCHGVVVKDGIHKILWLEGFDV